MRRAVLVWALAALCLWGQASTAKIQSVDATRQQAVVLFSGVSNPAQCTLTVYSDAALTQKVDDTNNALFAGSEACNRAGNLASAAVVGKRTSEMASDGKLHSRSLAVYTPYWAKLVDTSTSTTSVYGFTTQNIPWGDTHIELPQPNNSTFFGRAWPDLDWSDAGQNKSYVDPLTGVAFTRGARNRRGEGGAWGDDPFGIFAFNPPIDVHGKWTNVSNITSTSTSGPFASYSATSRDPVFLPFNPGAVSDGLWLFPNDGGRLTDDVAATIYGNAPGCTGADCNVLVCLGVDYIAANDTCPGSEITVTLPAGTATAQRIPSSYPSYQFAGWNLPKYLTSEQIGFAAGNASVTNSVVTLTSGALTPNAATGWKIRIGSNWYTIGTIKTAASFTLQESGVTTSGSWITGHFGIRIRKATTNSNTINVAAGWSYAYTYVPNIDANQQNRDYYSTLTFPVTYEADGTTPLSGCTGRLSVTGNGYQTVMLVVNPCPAHPNGETRALGPIKKDQPAAITLLGGFSQTNPFVMYALDTDPTDPGGGKSFWSVTYDSATCKFAAWSGNGYSRTNSVAGDCISMTNLNPYSSNPTLTINSQISAALASNAIWDPSLSQQFTMGGITGHYAMLGQWVPAGQQNNPCYLAIFDLNTFSLVKFFDSFTGTLPNYRWGGCHSNGLELTDHAGAAAFAPALLGVYGNSGYMAGPFELPGWTGKSLDGGVTWSSDTSLASGTLINTASAGGKCGPTPQWVIGSQCVDLTNVAGQCGANSLGVTGYRCVKFKQPQNKPCMYASHGPGSLMTSKWPCSWLTGGASAANMTVQVGDYISRGSPNNGGWFDGKNEKMQVVNISSDGSGGWIYELARWMNCDNPYSDQKIAPPACTFYDHLYTGQIGNTHPNGWTSYMVPPYWEVWFDASSPLASTAWKNDPSPVTAGGGHNTIAMSADGNSRMTLGNGSSRSGPILSQPATPADYYFSIDWSSWAGTGKGTNVLETYPTLGNWTSDTVRRRGLYYDWRHINPGQGLSGDNPAKVWGHTYTLVSGQQWTYKVDVYNSLGSSAQILKTRPPNVWSTRVGYTDISGPSSTISDTSPNGSYCVAYKANECVTGSAVGDVYVTAKGAWIEYGGCLANSLKAWTPCVANLESNAAWMIEGDTQTNDPLGTRFRRITMGLTGPAAQYGYTSPRVTPDGLLALARPSYMNGVRPDFMALKVPPPAMTDTIDRSDYVQVAVVLPAGSGYTRVRFGYAENGSSQQLYCTTRQESCLTDAAAKPFAYAQSDTLAAQDCRNGCTIQIPGLSGRVLYYRLERSPNGSSGWVNGPVQAKAVP